MKTKEKRENEGLPTSNIRFIQDTCRPDINESPRIFERHA